VIDREPHTLTEAQVEALEIVGRLVIADIELRRDLQELKDALAGPDAAEGPSGESALGLDEIISVCTRLPPICKRCEKEAPEEFRGGNDLGRR